MANEADVAQKFEQQHLAAAMSNRMPQLPKTGRCHNCSDPVPWNSAFCDSDCREDWEKRRHMKGPRNR